MGAHAVCFRKRLCQRDYLRSRLPTAKQLKETCLLHNRRLSQNQLHACAALVTSRHQMEPGPPCAVPLRQTCMWRGLLPRYAVLPACPVTLRWLEDYINVLWGLDGKLLARWSSQDMLATGLPNSCVREAVYGSSPHGNAARILYVACSIRSWSRSIYASLTEKTGDTQHAGARTL